MKRKIIFLNTFIVSLFLTPAFTVEAQTAKSAPTAQEEKDKREVTKFADSFANTYVRVKSLDKMPRYFFADSFRANFAKIDLFEESWSKAPVDEKSKYENNSLFNDLTNLLTILTIKNYKNNVGNRELENKNIYEILPPGILRVINKSKCLKALVAEDDDNAVQTPEPENAGDFQQCLNDLRKVNYAMKNYLNTHPYNFYKYLPRHKETFFAYYPADLCQGEDCMGLPENTPIFSVHEFMMCLRIARINGRLKIINIYSVAMED